MDASLNRSQLVRSKKKNPLIVLDGKVIGDTTALRKINPEIIESIEVIKYSDKNSEFLDKFYGLGAKDGVIKIVSKLTLEDKQKAMAIKLTQELECYEKLPEQYLFVKNGILVSKSEIKNLKELTSIELIAVERLKFETAKLIYGKDAKENTILINTKNVIKE